jgi:hypothetical protein
VGYEGQRRWVLWATVGVVFAAATVPMLGLASGGATGGIAVPASVLPASSGAAGQAVDCDIFMCGSNHNQVVL